MRAALFVGGGRPLELADVVTVSVTEGAPAA